MTVFRRRRGSRGELVLGPGGSAPLVPRKPSWVLLACAVMLVLIAGFMSADLLVGIGAMRDVLTSTDELTRHSAQTEVMAFRAFCLALAAGLLGIAVFWRQLAQSRFVQRLQSGGVPQIEDSAAHGKFFNVSLAVTLLSLLAGLGYEAIGGRIFSESQLRAINREDGVVETSQAVLFLLSALVAVTIAVRDGGNRRRVHAVMSFGFFLCAGEEVSWGQRIFGFNTFGMFKHYNIQGEINIHNLFGLPFENLFSLFVLLYGVLLPCLRASNPFFRAIFARLGLPLPSPGLAAGFLIVSLVHAWVIDLVLTPTSGLLFGELREMLTALAFLLLMAESWSKRCMSPG